MEICWTFRSKYMVIDYRLIRYPNTAVFILSSLIGCQVVVSQSTVNSLFETRARAILAQYDTVRSPDYYACGVQYARGKYIERANANALRLLEYPSGDVFWMLSSMTMYLHGKDVMSSKVSEAVRRAWKTYWPYRGDTENHWMMYYASLFLAAEQWPDLPGSDWFNGLSSEQNYKDAKEYLNLNLILKAREGFVEFDSPTYMPFFLGAMILLSDFSQDRETKIRAEMMCDLLLADFAVNNLNGQYAGGHSRSTERVALYPMEANTAGIASLYFDSPQVSRTQMEVICSLSKYRLPAIIYYLATDRNRSYESRKANMTRDILRLKDMTDCNCLPRNPIIKYTYMTSKYALSSLKGCIHPIQQHTWGLNIAVGSMAYSAFSLHPTWSEIELGMYFPEETKPLLEEVSLSKKYYTNPQKKIGGSFYERVYQKNNTLVALYNISENDPNPVINGYIPADADTIIVESNGWICLRYDDVYLGWYSMGPWTIVRESTHYNLRSKSHLSGFVVEVRSAQEVSSFDSFRESLRDRAPFLDTSCVSVTYMNIKGDLIELEPNYMNALINGQHDYSDISRVKYLWTGVHIPYKDNTLVLDFYNGVKYEK